MLHRRRRAAGDGPTRLAELDDDSREAPSSPMRSATMLSISQAGLDLWTRRRESWSSVSV